MQLSSDLVSLGAVQRIMKLCILTDDKLDEKIMGAWWALVFLF